MRVLMVSDVYFPRINGVSTAIQTYRQSLRAQGVEVRLIAPDYGQSCQEAWIRRVSARPVPRDPEDRLAHWSLMHEIVEEEIGRGCELIHIQTPFVAHYAGCQAAKRNSLPVIATYHTLFEEYLRHYAPFVPSSWLRALARTFSCRQCNALDGVIVPSRAIRQRLAEYGVKAPMHILPTGVRPMTPKPGSRQTFRQRFEIEESRPVVLFVGRVAHEKNIDFLIDTIDLVREWVPEILLLIAGEGPALTSLKRCVSERKLSAYVRFVGYLDRQEELPDCYAAADAFVFASRTETQGLVLLEAMSAGLPVVALAEMGTADILDARRGAIVPNDDPYAFAMALVRLLGDSGTRGRLGDEGKAYAAEWSDEALAGKMADLYRQIVTAHVSNRAGEFRLLPF